MKFLHGENTLPGVCIGDFNEILRPEEQLGPNERDSAQIAGFREAVDVCELADLGYKGLDWTFEKRVVGGDYCRVRLDRALATPSWSSRFPFASLEHLTAAKSDHSPILLLNELESSNLRVALKNPFRYECMWEQEDSFSAMVEQAWRVDQPATNVSELAAKLSHVAVSLKRWGRTTFGSVRQELRELRKQLAELRAEPTRVGPGVEEKKVQDRIVEVSYREEIMMRQRSRIRWLSEGDSNTQYFQKKASARRAKNTITQLQRDDGSFSTDPEELAGMASNFYEQLYTSEGTIGMEEGLTVAPTAPAINHLLFADDSLLFFEATSASTEKVRDLLKLYCEASGQRINTEKSAIYFSKMVPATQRTEIKNMLDVQNEALAEKYLGLPTDVGKAKEGCFRYLKDRIWKHIQGWMEKCLSAGGKEVLIKSVAQSIPTYSMSCFKLPRGLCEHINGLLRKFWWGSKQGQRKPAWVSWRTMCKPKFMGGLGFRDVELFNLALLSKQVWRLLQEPDTLTARVLKARYYPDDNILDAGLGRHPSQVWRSLLEGRDILALGLIKRIGSGTDTRVWEENWLPHDYKLKPICPISTNPPQLVSELIDPVSRTWNKQVINDHFLAHDADVILNIPLSSRVQPDFWAWHYDRKGFFSVRSVYRMINGIKFQREDWLEHRASHSNQERDKKAWSSLWKVKQELARVLVTMWAIWWARRRAIHDDEFQSPMSTMCFVNRYLEDLDIVSVRKPAANIRLPQQRSRGWISPGEEAAKINVDGAVSRNGRAGAAAAICRDKDGNYLGASAVTFDNLVDAAGLEAHACSEALALAKDLNISRVIIASDCLQVVSDINGRTMNAYTPTSQSE
ncbi:uncharacterized protein [Aegilops tauschii subsp. strangulata]|uniref:uncharacterized protein n=1 Tax=Aegilops tauschii subsp. strangulata TaxID=200361 RepID=UPI003CC8B66E